MQVDYTIVMGWSSVELASKVKSLLEKKWECIGGHTVHKFTGSTLRCSQAMILMVPVRIDREPSHMSDRTKMGVLLGILACAVVIPVTLLSQ